MRDWNKKSLGEILLCVAFISTIVYAQESPVEFANANLKAAVEDELWVNDPTPSDMLDLTELRCIDQGVVNLEGLEYATNLQTLWLRLNHISDISPLASCTQLKVLNLSKNKLISDLSPLAGLTHLHSLDCHLNLVSDLSFLTNLHELTYLVLRWNRVSDLSDLATMTQMQSLHLEYNLISDISPLAGLINLTSLDLSGNQISDISALSQMVKLQSLSLENNPITEVTALSSMSELSFLRVHNTQVSDLTPLCGLTKLKNLSLQDDPLNAQAYDQDLYAIVQNNPDLILSYSPNPRPPADLHLCESLYANSVRIFWDPVANGPSFTSYYRVYRLGPSDSGRTAIGTWQTATSYEDGDITNGEYTYWVQCAVADDGSGAGDFSLPLTTQVTILPRITIISGANGSVLVPGEGTYQYDTPTTISVSAQPSDPTLFVFDRWTGSAVTASKVADVTDANTTVTVDGDVTLVANFIASQHALEVSASDGGSVLVPGEGDYTYSHGTSISVVAAPKEGYLFAGWTGSAVNAGKVSDTSALNTTVLIDADYTLQANFMQENQYVLTVTSDGNGSTTGSGVYDLGTTVSITATPNTNFHFVNWTRNGSVSVADSNSSTTTVVLNGNGTVTAHFALDDMGSRTLTTRSTPGGTVFLPGLGFFDYDYGTQVTIQAEAEPGYIFKGWSGSFSSNINPLNVTLTRDVDLTAHFAFSRHTLDIESDAGGVITAPADVNAQYPDGSQVTVVVEQIDPNLFTFTGWKGSAVEAGCVADPNAQETIVTVNGNYTLVAGFLSRLAVIYVDDNAPADPGPNDPEISDPLESGTEGHPFDTIQEAINVAQEKATIRVREGIYRETINFLGKTIDVLGYDPNSIGRTSYPVIDANYTGTVVTFSPGKEADALLSGFVLTRGLDPNAGAILCEGADPWISHCVIVGNRCTAAHMDDDAGVIVCRHGRGLFVHCTVSDNEGGGGAVFRFTDCVTVISNSIVWGNQSEQGMVKSNYPSFMLYSNSDPLLPSLGNLSADPLFAQPGTWDIQDDVQWIWMEGDYHLQSEAGRWNPQLGQWQYDHLTSPCIGAGNQNVSRRLSWYPLSGNINCGAYGGTLAASR